MPEVEFPALDRFESGPARPMLDPAEVRRLGDRHRHRRNALTVGAGAFAVAMAVGLPVLAQSGNDDRDVQPAPTPTDSEPAWITSMPGEFPLADRFPGSAEMTNVPDPGVTPTCGMFFTGNVQDQLAVTYTGESERAQRWLILLAHETSAMAAMDQARAEVDACRAKDSPSSDGTEKVYATVPVDLGTEDSFAWTQQVEHDDGRLTDLAYVQVARTGNAVYVESSYSVAGGDQVVADVQRRLIRGSAEPLAMMCIFAADPCLDIYAPPGPVEQVPGGATPFTLTPDGSVP